MPLGYINGGISSDFFSILASLAPENLDNSKIRPVVILFHYGESWNLLRADQRLIFAKSWPGFPVSTGTRDLFILRSDLPSQVFIRRKVRRVMLPTY